MPRTLIALTCGLGLAAVGIVLWLLLAPPPPASDNAPVLAGPLEEERASAGPAASPVVIDPIEETATVEEANLLLGRVTDLQEVPLQGARIRAWPIDGREGEASWQDRTDLQGAFRLEELRGGTVWVEVDLEGHSMVPPEGLAVAVGLAELHLYLEPACSIEGVVLGPGDEPVAGARVRAALGVQGLGRAARTSSTQIGTFHLGNLPPGPHAVWARHLEIGSTHRVVHLERGEQLRGLVLTLEQGLALGGIVRNQLGESLELVTVQVEEYRTPQGQPPWPGIQQQTDGDGAFHVTGLGAHRYLLRVSGPGHLPSPPFVCRAGNEQLELVLTLGGILTGVVEDAGGAPVQGAQVLAWYEEEEARTRRPPGLAPPAPEVHRAITDREGRYELTTLPEGDLQLAARHGELGPSPTVQLGIACGLVQEAPPLILGAGASLEGAVEGLDGEPIVQAQVSIRPLHPDEIVPPPVQSDPQGRFQVRGLVPDAQYELGAAHPDHLPLVGCGPYAPGEQGIVLQLRAGATLEVRVRTREGKPVQGGTVSAHLVRPRSRESRRAWTSARGLAVLRPLRAGAWEVGVQARGHCPRTGHVEVSADGGVVTLELTLQALPEGVIRGRVVAGPRDPVQGATVTARALTPPGLMPRPPVVQATSDPEGSFELTGIGEWPYEISARREDLIPAADVPVTAMAGDQVVLELCRRGTVSGLLRDPEGWPVQEFWGSLARWRRPVGEPVQFVDPDGRFALVLPPELQTNVERSSILLRAPGYPVLEKEIRLHVRCRDQQLTPLFLERFLVATGRVVDAAGEPVAGALVETRLDSPALEQTDLFDPRPPRTVTGADGSFRLEQFPRRRIDSLVVTHQEYPELHVGLGYYREADIQDLVLTLQRASALQLEVRYASGYPAVGLQVILRRFGEPRLRGTRAGTLPRAEPLLTDAKGRLRMSGLPPGKYHLMIQDPDTLRRDPAVWRGEVELPPGKTLRLPIEL